jgi:hypothetical protein
MALVHQSTPSPRFLLLAVILPLIAEVTLIAQVLEVHPSNPRWLTSDGGERALVLTGAHTWSLFQDYDFDRPFKANRYLGGLHERGHNFTRGWFWEDGFYSPLPYAQVDGEYRLSAPYSKEYLKRLRKRIRAARRRGLFISVMLFQGWSMDDRSGLRDPGPWSENPYNRNNTSESVSKQQSALHIGNAQKQQLEYVSFLARNLCARSNVVWEIVNEAHPDSLGTANASSWQRKILQHLRSECGSRLTWVSCPDQSGLTGAERSGLTEIMMSMNSDLVTPCRPDAGFVENPAVADGLKVVVADTDHFIPEEVTPQWVWRAFLRGQHPIFMDLTKDLTWWNGKPWDRSENRWKQVHRALGAVQELVGVVNSPEGNGPASGLAQLAPQAKAGDQPGNQKRPAGSEWALFSSDKPCPARKKGKGRCAQARANGDEFLVYADPNEAVRVCRLRIRGEYRYRWKKAMRSGFVAPSEKSTADSRGCLKLRNPSKKFAVLHLERTTG